MMIAKSCSLHEELEASLRKGRLSEGLRLHSEACEICRNTAIADEMLRQLVALCPEAPSSSKTEDLWWRSRVLRRLTEANRCEDRRPLRLVALFASVVPLILVISASSWACLDHFGKLDPSLLPLLIAGAVLMITPALGWLTLWLADEVLRPA